MATAIGDFMEGQFVIETESGYPEDNATTQYWEERNFLRVGSLQANSCQSALALANHDEHVQQRAYDFGRNFALAWQAFNELQPFLQPYVQPTNTTPTFELRSAPVLQHIQHAKENLDKFRLATKQADGKPAINYKKLHAAVNEGAGIEQTKQLIISYSNKALEALDHLPPSDAVNALSNIVYAVREH